MLDRSFDIYSWRVNAFSKNSKLKKLCNLIWNKKNLFCFIETSCCIEHHHIVWVRNVRECENASRLLSNVRTSSRKKKNSNLKIFLWREMQSDIFINCYFDSSSQRSRNNILPSSTLNRAGTVSRFFSTKCLPQIFFYLFLNFPR